MTKRVTKRDYIQMYFDFFNSEEVKDLDRRLNALEDQKRITSGARYYVYNPYEWYGAKLFQDILSRAAKAKCYNTYINDRKKCDYEYAWEHIQENFAKAISFVEENEQCAFEDSQYQKLVAESKIQGDEEEEQC